MWAFKKGRALTTYGLLSIAENVQRGGGRKREEEGRENIHSRRGYRDQRKNKIGSKSISYTGPINGENSIHSDRNLDSAYPIDA